MCNNVVYLMVVGGMELCAMVCCVYNGVYNRDVCAMVVCAMVVSVCKRGVCLMVVCNACVYMYWRCV